MMMHFFTFYCADLSIHCCCAMCKHKVDLACEGDGQDLLRGHSLLQQPDDTCNYCTRLATAWTCHVSHKRRAVRQV